MEGYTRAEEIGKRLDYLGSGPEEIGVIIEGEGIVKLESWLIVLLSCKIC